MVGGKRHEIHDALTPLFDCATEGHYIISLDFSLAVPRLATFIFAKLGHHDFAAVDSAASILDF